MSEILEQDEQAWQRADELLDMQMQLKVLQRLRWNTHFDPASVNIRRQDLRFLASKLGIADEFDKLINYKHGI